MNTNEIPYRISLIPDESNNIERKSENGEYYLVQLTPMPVVQVINGRKVQTIQVGANKKFFEPHASNTIFAEWIKGLLEDESNFTKLQDGTIVLKDDYARVGKIVRVQCEPYTATLKNNQSVTMNELATFVPAEDAEKEELYIARALKRIKTWVEGKGAPTDSEPTAIATETKK